MRTATIDQQLAQERAKLAEAVAEIKGHHEKMAQAAQAVDEALARAAEILRAF